MPRRVGRKPKPNHNGRDAKGRLKRVVHVDQGCDGVIRRRAAFGIHGAESHDAIGRAYAAGLLGTGERAKDYRDAARRINRQYWAAYGVDFAMMTPLERFVPGKGGRPRDELTRRISEQALNDALADIEKLGRAFRSAFDDLVIDNSPDEGPLWLNRLIAAQGNSYDRARIEAAIRALEEIC